MKKIRVVDTNIKSVRLTRIERELRYKTLLKQNEVDNVYINDIVELEEYSFELKDLLTPVALHFINLKKILYFVIPIISNYPTITKKIEADTNIQLPFASFAFVLKDSKLFPYRIPSGEKFEVIGFVFPQKSKIKSIYRYVKNNAPFELNEFKFSYGTFLFTDIKNRELFIDENTDSFYIDHSWLHRKKDKDIVYYLIDEQHRQDNVLFIYILERIAFYMYRYHTLDTLLYSNYYCTIFYDKDKIDSQRYISFQQQNFSNKNNYYSKQLLLNDSPIIKEFNKISPIHVNPYFTASMYSVLQLLQFSILYDYLIIYGTSHQRIKKIMDRIQYEKEQYALSEFNTKTKQKEVLRNITLERITRKIFPDLFNANSKEYLFSMKSLFHIQKLPKKYKETVTLMYEKQQKLLEAMMQNTCKHIHDLKKYRAEPSLDTFNAIKKYIKISKNGTEMLKCTICSFDLICIHEYEFYDKLSKIQDDYSFEKENIIISDIIEKYKTNVPIQFTFYCDICSKELGKSIDIEQYTAFVGERRANVSSVYDEDPINLQLLYLAKNIISKHTDLSQLNTSKKKFTYMIVNIIYPFVKLLDDQLSKSKTIVDKPVIINIHSIIYIFVAITYISSNAQILLLRDIRGGKKEPKHKIELDIIKQSFSIIFKIIIKIPDFNKSKITKDKLKSLLIEYYRSITTASVILEETKGLNYELLRSIYNSTIYQYVSFIRQFISSEKIDTRNIYKIIGKKQEVLLHIKDRKKYSYQQYESIMDNIYDSIIPKNVYNDAELKIIRDHTDYVYKSFYHAIYLYITKGIYKIAPLLKDNIIETSMKKYIEEYEILGQLLKDYDIQLKREQIQKNKLISFILPSENSRESEYKLNNAHLVYCLDGTRHTFEYQVQYGSKKKLLRTDEMQKLLDDKDYISVPFQIHDLICKKCNISYNDINKQSESKINTWNKTINHAISENNNVNIFFNLFFHACPEKDKHVFQSVKNEEARCMYCKVSRSQLIQHDISYYTKYKKVFDEYFSRKKEEFEKVINEISQFRDIVIPDTTTALKKINISTIFQSNIEIIHILSKKFKIEPYILTYLGKLDNVSYTEIPKLIKENKMEEIVKENEDVRASRLLEYGKTLSIYYNIIRNHTPFYRSHDTELNILLNRIKDKKIILSKLPELDYDIQSYYQGYSSTVTSKKELNEILLFIILQNIMSIYNKSMNRSHEKEIYLFIDMVLHKYIYQDQLYSTYNFSQLKISKVEKKEVHVEPEEVPIEIEDELGEDDLFSYDHLDIDSDLLEDGYDIDVDIDK